MARGGPPKRMKIMWGQGFGPAAGLMRGAKAYVRPRAARKRGGSPEGLAPHGLSTERPHFITRSKN